MHLFLPIVAHAFGKRYDLPVPLALFVFGGAAVVFASFLLVLPTAVAATAEGPARRDRIALRRPAGVGMAIAIAVVAALVVAGWTGSQEVAENIVPTAFWLLIWIAVPISCGLLGDWTRPINPFAAVARICDRTGLRRALLARTERSPWPQWLGFWPATFLFFAIAFSICQRPPKREPNRSIACGELIYNGTATIPSVTASALVIYLAVNSLCGLVFGAEAWVARGEVFSVLWSTWGRIGWFRFGAPGRRGFFGGLEVPFEAGASRITFVLLLLVSVSFDGLLSTPAWKTLVGRLPDALLPGTTLFLVFETGVFLGLAGFAWLLFGGFAAAVRAAGHLDASWRETLAGLMRSLLPISLGYLIAHNTDYLAINGQLLVPLLGNPGGWTGVHLLPAPFNDTYEVNPNLLPSAVLWYGEVALIIFVHIAAVVLAHRYLGREARVTSAARRAEWPWIAAMVARAAGGRRDRVEHNQVGGDSHHATACCGCHRGREPRRQGAVIATCRDRKRSCGCTRVRPTRLLIRMSSS